MENNLLSVIIVTWNSMQTIQECLDSVYCQEQVQLEVIVVDNGSTDGSREFIIENYPGIKTIFNDRNLGYSRSNNQGIETSKGDYIVLLNADAILKDDCLYNFFVSIKEDPGVGSISGKILKLDGSRKIIDPTGIVLNRKKFSPSDRGEGLPDEGQYNKKEYIFGASGAAAFYSKKMLENIRVNNEIFDEDFFSYYEDLDLAWRAQLYGWKCLYVPEAVVYHLRKGPKAQNKKIYIHSFKNRYLCYIKNESTRMEISWYC